MRACFTVVLILSALLVAGCGAPQRDLAPTPIPYPETLGKRGVGAVWDGCQGSITDEVIEELNITWIFTWQTALTVDADVETVAMIWGEQYLTEGCPVIGASSQWLLGFNEPEVSDQANLTPQRGAELWRVVEQCYPDKLLVSPAVVFDLDWLARMRDAYIARYGEPPRFDALGMHCYSKTDVYRTCRQHLEYMEPRLAEWNVPGGIWINEWALWVPEEKQAEQIEQIKATVLMLEGNPNVARYAMWVLAYEDGSAWYIPKDAENRLWDCEESEITALGAAYADTELRTVYLPLIVSN